MKKLLIVIALSLAACTELSSETQETTTTTIEEGCDYVTSSVPLNTGDVITGNLRNITIQNGKVRLRYGSHAMDFRDTGVQFENTERHLDHVLAARHTDHPTVASTPGCLGACHNGSHWHDTQYSWYGDGITYSSGTFNSDADRLRVIESSPEAIELAYEWDEVRLDVLRNSSQCILGVYPECGPTDRDAVGAAVWKSTLTDTVKSVKKVKVWKTVRLERCKPGYYVSLRSEPRLIWPEQGTRSIRTGYGSAKSVWTCDGLTVGHHPTNGTHIPMGVINCMADVSEPASGTHNGWPFIKVIKTAQPWFMSSLEYPGNNSGAPGVNEIWDAVGPDGRPTKWQAFIGAAEYESPDTSLEPTTQALTITNQITSGVTF